jgi:diguanylate cyclase (GGDEF)-like protein/PAS domain S-box-containing protein
LEQGLALFLELAVDDDSIAAADPGMAMFRKILNGLNDAVLVTTAAPTDAPGPIIVFGNETLEKMTGYSLEEILGRTPRMLQGPDTDAHERQRIAAALRDWKPVSAELLNYRKDGSTFWVELSIVPLADSNGWYTHWISVQRDITARKEVEKAEQEQAALVQSILNSMPAQTVVMDQTGMMMGVNDAWRRFWWFDQTQPEPEWTSLNYFSVVGENSDPNDPAVIEATHGILSVIQGQAGEFSMDYPCRAHDELYWFHIHILPLPSVSGIVITHIDITDRKRAEADLLFQATHDSLTQLPNRELLQDHLSQALEFDRRMSRHTHVAVLDLDNFKDVNDAYGHAYGDIMLQRITQRLNSCMGESDFLARVGGDEFVLVFSNRSAQWDIEAAMNRIREVVCGPMSLQVTSVRPSMSIGVVSSPDHQGDTQSILRDADTAMYESKRSGRDRWTRFSPAVRDSLLARTISADRVIEALQTNLFELHYQPLIDISSGKTVGTEALLRLRAPDGRLLMPGEFLSAIENGPLAQDVGHWVLSEALRQHSLWLKHQPDLRMSINVSPRQLGHDTLPGQIEELLDKYQINPRLIVMELTEDVIVDVSGQAGPELAAIRGMGLRLAVDDFGTGYSSLAYLQDLDFDVLKVDRVFVRNASSNGRGALLGAIAELARSVGATPIAEGVETFDQLALLQEMGFTRAQGYLLGRPTAPGETAPTCLVDVHPSVAATATLDMPSTSEHCNLTGRTAAI